jgi:hypothetical protein
MCSRVFNCHCPWTTHRHQQFGNKNESRPTSSSLGWVGHIETKFIPRRLCQQWDDPPDLAEHWRPLLTRLNIRLAVRNGRQSTAACSAGGLWLKPLVCIPSILAPLSRLTLQRAVSQFFGPFPYVVWVTSLCPVAEKGLGAPLTGRRPQCSRVGTCWWRPATRITAMRVRSTHISLAGSNRVAVAGPSPMSFAFVAAAPFGLSKNDSDQNEGIERWCVCVLERMKQRVELFSTSYT